jgi:MFS family permease
MLAMALVFGAANNSVYPLCVAQTFDRLDRKYYVAASGRLLMVYAVGATTGPLIAASLMSLYGPPSFFIFESAIAIIYAVFVLVSVKFGPALPEEGEREKFVQVPDISPVAMRLDPRTEPEDEPAKKI